MGDIVIPGFFLSILLRFDAHRADLPYLPNNIHAPFPKPYFHLCLMAYFAGFATTLFVMISFNADQPVIVYLVPNCLGILLSCAAYRGDLKILLSCSKE